MVSQHIRLGKSLDGHKDAEKYYVGVESNVPSLDLLIHIKHAGDHIVTKFITNTYQSLERVISFFRCCCHSSQHVGTVLPSVLHLHSPDPPPL